MKRIAAILAVILSLSLLSVPFGAVLVTVTSPARLVQEIACAQDMAVINLSKDMTFGEDCKSLYLNKSIVLRGDKVAPVTLTEGRFIVEGQSELPITVVFENINFTSTNKSSAPAIEVKGNVKLTFSGCTFDGYSASAVRIFADDDRYINATFKNCLFDGNSIFWGTGMGGGLYAEGRNLTLNMSGCVFKENGSCDGGGLAFVGANVTLTNCTFTDNGAKSFGGGIYGQKGSLTLNNCIFGLNSAKDCGGGIALSDVKLTMVDCVVASNSTRTAGGGLWLEEVEHPHYDGVDTALLSGYPFNRDVNIDNCSFYLNLVDPVYSSSDPDSRGVKFELLGDIDVNIRLSTFAYNGDSGDLYINPYIDFFGCILEEDGIAKQMPSQENGYCLIYDEDGSQPTIDSEHRLSDFPHLNCVNDHPDLRIPIDAVKEAYVDTFSGYYGTFPVGDNYGEVEMSFTFHSLRTQIVKATRGTPIPEIPAPMRDMYSFGGWYLPDGNQLAGYRLLVGGDVNSIEFSPLWTHNTKYYLTLAGCGFAIVCGVIGWVVIKKRMRAVQLPESADGL